MKVSIRGCKTTESEETLMPLDQYVREYCREDAKESRKMGRKMLDENV